MKEISNYLEMANSPLMWLAAAIPVSVVIFQSVLFIRKSLEAAKATGITQDQLRKAVKSSAVSSLGPSAVILVTMISLIVSMGAPVSWMRLSLIGSVNYEAMAAGFGAQAMGTDLEHLTPIAFSCGLWVMTLGMLGCMIFVLLFTDKMDKVNNIMSRGNSKMVPIISAGAMLGAFANLASGNFFTAEGQFSFGGAPALATIIGCALMMVLSKLAKERNISWLREWAFAISMFTGMIAGYAWSLAV